MKVGDLLVVLSVSFTIFRSSGLQMIYKIGFLENFANFIEKHLRYSLFFNKLAGLAFFHRTPPVAASELLIITFLQRVLRCFYIPYSR